MNVNECGMKMGTRDQRPRAMTPAGLLKAGLLLGLSALVLTTTLGCDDRRTIEQVTRDLRNLRPPSEEDAQAKLVFQTKQAELIRELYELSESKAGLGQLMSQRWLVLLENSDPRIVLNETANVLSEPTADAGFKSLATYFQARALVRQLREDPRRDPEPVRKAVADFAAANPNAPVIPELRVELAMAEPELPVRRAALTELISSLGSQLPKDLQTKVKEELDRIRGVGEPFPDFEFPDVLTGKTIRLSDLKGKVVVLDFWASWCVPCLVELPRMKQLYAKYKDQGVEFIGLSVDSLDEKGINDLKKCITDNEIPWPQFHSAPVNSLIIANQQGIDTIPRILLLDGDGVLVTREARGQLDRLIPEQLAKLRERPASASANQNESSPAVSASQNATSEATALEKTTPQSAPNSEQPPADGDSRNPSSKPNADPS